MSTFLTVVLVFFGLIAVLVMLGLYWLSKKARLAKGYLVYGGLVLGIEALKQHAAKPENANDEEVAALLGRAETAQKAAKAELDKGNVEGAVALVMPALEELGNFKAAYDKKRADEAALASAAVETTVIDVEAQVVEPLQLPAPTATTAAEAAVVVEAPPSAGTGHDHTGSTPDTVSGAPSYATKK